MVRRPGTLITSERSTALTLGALVASTAFLGINADEAAAADIRDARMRVIADALKPASSRPLGPIRFAADDAAAEQSQTFTLNVPAVVGVPLMLRAALFRLSPGGRPVAVSVSG